MAIESKNLLTVIKAYARANKLPLDYTEVWESLAEAQAYLNHPTAYAGQTIKVNIDGTYKTYTLQQEGDSLVMQEIGAEVKMKQYVQVVSSLPESGQEQGVLYLNTTDNTGSIYTGTEYKPIISNTQVEIGKLRDELNAEIAKKAPIESPTFTGTVTLANDPTQDLQAVTKQYVDRLIAGIESAQVPGIVSSTSPLPTEGYKAGMTYRVAENGTYADNVCEAGDLIIVLKDHVAETASNDDFMVVQANINGAVTSSSVSTDLNIAVYDGITGKIIKDSNVNIASINDAIAKAHTHSNKAVLDTYNKTQTELLAAAKAEVDSAVETINTTLDGKADKGTSLADYGITDAYTKTDMDNIINTIQTNLNTKLDGAAVDAKIATAKTETLEEAATVTEEAINARVGDIPSDTTIKSYVDMAGSGGAASAEAIAKAKQEAIDASKAYTDSKLTITEF